MPRKKKASPSSSRSSSQKQRSAEEEIRERVQSLSKEIKSLTRKAKEMYGDLDTDTKKKIVAGIAALGGVLVAGKMMRGGRKRKKQ